jgi:hypothetical protein
VKALVLVFLYQSTTQTGIIPARPAEQARVAARDEQAGHDEFVGAVTGHRTVG